jgi:hypothetical protein
MVLWRGSTIKLENSAPSPSSSECQHKATLLTAYKAAKAQHDVALAKLDRNAGTSTRLDYVALCRAFEILRKDAADLWEELEQHVKQHGC